MQFIRNQKTIEAMKFKLILKFTCVALPIFVAGCSSVEEKGATLRSIDVSDESSLQADVFVKPKSEQEIRDAYYSYIQNATKDDKSRLSALSRLAELELELSNDLLKRQQQDAEPETDQEFLTTTNKTIDLLNTSLKDYPEAKGNDKILYQLAKAYDQIGEHAATIDILSRLVEQYPKSPYYAESQFRLAEYYFITANYIDAEDSYTEVILSPDNHVFYEKALFKRGWARYKQQLYLEAVDDYLDAVTYHEFEDYYALEKSEKEQFEEYFRAIGLAFSYLGGADPLRNYFASDSDFKYLFHTYATVSDTYLKQERYSDAVSTLEQFNQANPRSEYIPESHLKIIQIWQQSRFTNRLYDAIESFYVSYHPDSEYWRTGDMDSIVGKSVAKSLKQYVVLVAEYFHSQYQRSNKQTDFQSAQTWYERYLRHYSSYARQDNIYYLYAELLDQAELDKQSISYYELVAYDGDIILDKTSAYATIDISDRLYRNSSDAEKGAWLDRYLRYTQLFSQLYPNDERTPDIVVQAAELAYLDKRYTDAINLTEQLPQNVNNALSFRTNIVRAESYFNNNEFSNAEAAYTEIMASNELNSRQRKQNMDRLALSIYKQGESNKNAGNNDQAKYDFMRIADLVPNSDIAATGVYDAISLAMANSSWNEAISYIDTFQGLYPKHQYSADITKKLSVAYLNSDQSLKAAKEFERISALESNIEVKMAALLQAAELYEQKEDWSSAIRSYRDYANTYPNPFPQHMEAMNKLSELYALVNDTSRAYFWQNKIRQTDRKASRSLKTDRTNYIASIALLQLAKEKHQVFSRRRLVIPLDENLRKKKSDMQQAVNLYGQASVYGISDITTEATHSIGSIYREFSRALLESERPKALNDDELEQYEILLEDQAFPFEEKAIEFYETNISRTKDNTYDQWIERSFTNLTELFPVRYKRQGKLELSIDELF